MDKILGLLGNAGELSSLVGITRVVMGTYISGATMGFGLPTRFTGKPRC